MREGVGEEIWVGLNNSNLEKIGPTKGGGPTSVEHHKEDEVMNSFRTPRPTK
jgi:hypothetical protein